MKAEQKSWSARQVHEELAMMAWQNIRENGPLHPEVLLNQHVAEMSRILNTPALYAELWRRVRQTTKGK